MKKPIVYIILLNWNGLNDTVECLESLQNIDYPDHEIIVVDNGSKDTSEIKTIKNKFPRIMTIINDKNIGFCKGNNQGIELALKNGADYVMLLNNDTIVKKNFLSELIGFYIKNPDTGAISPAINYYRSNKLWYGGGLFNWKLGVSKHKFKNMDYSKIKNIKPYYTEYISGCCFFTSSKILKEVGVLDEDYFAYYEDSDLSFRITEQGHKLVIVPNSVIEHKVSMSTGISNNKWGAFHAYLYARNGFLFGTKRFKGLKKIIYLFAQISIKLAYYPIMKCENSNVISHYFSGLKDGILSKPIDEKYFR